MKVFLDVSNLAHQQLTGIGVYTKNIHRHLQALAGPRFYPVCSLSRWHHRKRVEHHLSSTVNSSLLIPHLPCEVKLLHVPDHRISTTTSDILVQTIHDLSPFEEGNYSDSKFKRTFKKRFDKILHNPKLDQVITVSLFSKSRILDFYPHLNGRIKVIPLGANHLPQALCRDHIGPWPYLLFAGTLELRKNVLGLLAAFKELAPRFSELRLLLLGKEGYGSEQILKEIENHPYKERIIWKKFVSADTLATAYKYAEALVFPSFYEGFGLPVIEAMRYRCPVVCSNIPSLTEIGGNAIQLFNPHDINDMADAIEKILLNPTPRFLLKNLGEIQSQKFIWENTAKKTWDTYLELLRVRLREDLPSNRWSFSPYSGHL